MVVIMSKVIIICFKDKVQAIVSEFSTGLRIVYLHEYINFLLCILYTLYAWNLNANFRQISYAARCYLLTQSTIS